MKIAYISGESVQKKSKPSKSQQDRISARRWMAIQDEANFQKALKFYEARIKAIQKIDPSWKPLKIKRANSN